MLFFASICSQDIETLPSKDHIKVCATKLPKECQEFDILLDASYLDAQDVKIRFEQ